jgi:hypothetical protein
MRREKLRKAGKVLARITQNQVMRPVLHEVPTKFNILAQQKVLEAAASTSPRRSNTEWAD